MVVRRHFYFHLGSLRVAEYAEGAHKNVRGGYVVLAAGDRLDEIEGVTTYGACRARPAVDLVVYLKRLIYSVTSGV